MQGFNMGKYVPPDLEGVVSGNKLHSKHALGARASKISQGILTVRFEMPYPIWCTSCPKPTIIGQGVRFNAEKKKVGNYYSTPIFSFRMKHAACGGWIEIRTDPKNTAYVVVEGARQRDLGEDKVLEGDTKILTEQEREELRNNAFANLEGKVEDKKRFEQAKERIEELQDVADKQWEDPYERNRKLRKAFRVGRKEREKEAGVASKLQDKMSFGFDLLPEHEDDVKRAALVDFGNFGTDDAITKAVARPLFRSNNPSQNKKRHGEKQSKGSKKTKSEELAKVRREAIAAEIRGNTRAAIDPFLLNGSTKNASTPLLAGVKRKRPESELRDTISSTEDNNAATDAAIGSLVDYDSD
ncbi:CWC16 protein [Xylogone sp. PMI_703]|nr:CWC16 protein [Xylogone sp. PMI_703]